MTDKSTSSAPASVQGPSGQGHLTLEQIAADPAAFRATCAKALWLLLREEGGALRLPPASLASVPPGAMLLLDGELLKALHPGGAAAAIPPSLPTGGDSPAKDAEAPKQAPVPPSVQSPTGREPAGRKPPPPATCEIDGGCCDG